MPHKNSKHVRYRTEYVRSRQYSTPARVVSAVAVLAALAAFFVVLLNL